MLVFWQVRALGLYYRGCWLKCGKSMACWLDWACYRSSHPKSCPWDDRFSSSQMTTSSGPGLLSMEFCLQKQIQHILGRDTRALLHTIAHPVNQILSASLLGIKEGPHCIGWLAVHGEGWRWHVTGSSLAGVLEQQAWGERHEMKGRFWTVEVTEIYMLPGLSCKFILKGPMKCQDNFLEFTKVRSLADR